MDEPESGRGKKLRVEDASPRGAEEGGGRPKVNKDVPGRRVPKGMGEEPRSGRRDGGDNREGEPKLKKDRDR